MTVHPVGEPGRPLVLRSVGERPHRLPVPVALDQGLRRGLVREPEIEDPVVVGAERPDVVLVLMDDFSLEFLNIAERNFT